MKAGPGRPPGSRNKATAKREAEIAASGQTPLEFMLERMRSADRDEAERFAAAVAAAPYVHPKLASTTVKGDEEHPLQQVIRWAQDSSEATQDPSKKS